MFCLAAQVSQIDDVAAACAAMDGVILHGENRIQCGNFKAGACALGLQPRVAPEMLVSHILRTKQLHFHTINSPVLGIPAQVFARVNAKP